MCNSTVWSNIKTSHTLKQCAIVRFDLILKPVIIKTMCNSTVWSNIKTSHTLKQCAIARFDLILKPVIHQNNVL